MLFGREEMYVSDEAQIKLAEDLALAPASGFMQGSANDAGSKSVSRELRRVL